MPLEIASWRAGCGHSAPWAGLGSLAGRLGAAGGGGAGAPSRKELLMETKIFAFEKPGVGERALGLPWKPIAEPRRSRRHSHSVSGSAVAEPMRAQDTTGHIPGLCVKRPWTGEVEKEVICWIGLVCDGENGLRVRTQPYSSLATSPVHATNHGE